MPGPNDIEIRIQARDQTTAAVNSAKANITGLGGTVQSQLKSINSAVRGFYKTFFAGYAAKKVFDLTIRPAIDRQHLRQQLQFMTGDIRQATRALDVITKLKLTAPVEGLEKAAKTLLSAGVTLSRLPEQLAAVGAIARGRGVSAAEIGGQMAAALRAAQGGRTTAGQMRELGITDEAVISRIVKGTASEQVIRLQAATKNLAGAAPPPDRLTIAGEKLALTFTNIGTVLLPVVTKLAELFEKLIPVIGSAIAAFITLRTFGFIKGTFGGTAGAGVGGEGGASFVRGAFGGFGGAGGLGRITTARQLLLEEGQKEAAAYTIASDNLSARAKEYENAPSFKNRMRRFVASTQWFLASTRLEKIINPQQSAYPPNSAVGRGASMLGKFIYSTQTVAQFAKQKVMQPAMQSAGQHLVAVTPFAILTAVSYALGDIVNSLNEADTAIERFGGELNKGATGFFAQFKNVFQFGGGDRTMSSLVIKPSSAAEIVRLRAEHEQQVAAETEAKYQKTAEFREAAEKAAKALKEAEHVFNVIMQQANMATVFEDTIDYIEKNKKMAEQVGKVLVHWGDVLPEDKVKKLVDLQNEYLALVEDGYEAQRKLTDECEAAADAAEDAANKEAERLETVKNEQKELIEIEKKKKLEFRGVVEDVQDLIRNGQLAERELILRNAEEQTAKLREIADKRAREHQLELGRLEELKRKNDEALKKNVDLDKAGHKGRKQLKKDEEAEKKHTDQRLKHGKEAQERYEENRRRRARHLGALPITEQGELDRQFYLLTKRGRRLDKQAKNELVNKELHNFFDDMEVGAREKRAQASKKLMDQERINIDRLQRRRGLREAKEANQEAVNAVVNPRVNDALIAFFKDIDKETAVKAKQAKIQGQADIAAALKELEKDLSAVRKNLETKKWADR